MKVVKAVIALIIAIGLAFIIFSLEKRAVTSITGTISQSAVGQSPVSTEPKNDSNYQPNIESKNQPSAPTSDLISFSISPNTKVHGILSYRGILQGGYFFEGNVLINILDANKKVLKQSNAVAKGEWMTAGPVNFEGNIDFTGLAKGPAYFEIHNDNASGLPQNSKSVLVPIVIE